MVSGLLKPLVVFWTGWGIHFMVLLSFMVQVTLLLLADIRRRKDWAWLKVIIWSAYMLADTAAIYALGHMSVVCNWSPEHHQLMALWAPLLLVHLGGQDNITAYAIEDNRLWLRHLQNFTVQVAAAGYVLYVSSILSHPMSSKVSLAAMLMFVVGVLKYGERIWALMRADSCASSSLSARSYAGKKVSRSAAAGESDFVRTRTPWSSKLIIAYSLLDVPKQMFEGPASYVQTVISWEVKVMHDAKYMLDTVQMQLWMMYDLLYTKAAVVHTWYGLSTRVLISLPFTIAALSLFWSSSTSSNGRADVAITNVLLIGAVVLETMSVLRAIFSKWTAVLLYRWGWNAIGTVLFVVEVNITLAMALSVRSGAYWSGRMRQHNLFQLASRSAYSRGSRIARMIGLEDWWDSNVYSWTTPVPDLVITKVLELLAKTTEEDITTSHGLNALRRGMNNNDQLVVSWIWTSIQELKLEERILVWHIATHVYLEWCRWHHPASSWTPEHTRTKQAAVVLADYMFFLLAARPYMLPYPVSRQAYVQLCSDAVTYVQRSDFVTDIRLNRLETDPLEPSSETVVPSSETVEPSSETVEQSSETVQKPFKITLLNTALWDALEKRSQFQLYQDIGPQRNVEIDVAAQPQPQPQTSWNRILDRGCQLAAKLIHITQKQAESTVNGEGIILEQAETFSVNAEVILDMLLEVWVEMLCYTAYFCNENSHARHLTDGGEMMTIITLLIIYRKNGLVIRQNTSTSGGTAGPSSSQGVGSTESVV